MTKDEYVDFVLRYKGCGACFPMYHTLSRFEKMWFTAIQKDVAELEKENTELKNRLEHRNCLDCSNHSSKLRMRNLDLEKENAELRKVAEFQQSSNISRYFENKKLKEGLAVGSMWNKHLNSQNKALEEEMVRYRNMTFDQREQLTKAKEIIKDLLSLCEGETDSKLVFTRAEQFLKE